MRRAVVLPVLPAPVVAAVALLMSVEPEAIPQPAGALLFWPLSGVAMAAQVATAEPAAGAPGAGIPVPASPVPAPERTPPPTSAAERPGPATGLPQEPGSSSSGAETSGPQSDDPQTHVDARDRLEALEGALAAVRLERLRLDQEEDSLTREHAETTRAIAALGAEIARHEDRAQALGEDLKTLDQRRKELADRLRRGSTHSSALLNALERLTRRPPAVVLLGEREPAAAIRSAIVLRTAVSAMEDELDLLRADIVRAEETAAALADRRQVLAATRDAITAGRARLQALDARKAALKEALAEHRSEAAARETRLTQRIEALTALARRLQNAERATRALQLASIRLKPPAPGEDQKQTAADAPSEPPPSGPRQRERTERHAGAAGPVFPATGRIVTRFGSETPPPSDPAAAEPAARHSARSWARHQGVTIATEPGSRVVAPAPGTVEFAGPFRGYGLLLIVKHANGYHSLLAGLDRIDKQAGHRVLSGEPIGAMARPTIGNPYLYLELRKDGQPINPLPWLTAGKQKVSG